MVELVRPASMYKRSQIYIHDRLDLFDSGIFYRSHSLQQVREGYT